jgi:chromosome segregation ATPase
MMSKTESTAEDAKKLAQRCKALEAQLRQTITKKEHHEIVLEFEDKMTDMEKTIAGQEKKTAEQEKELTRMKADLQKTTALNTQLTEVGGRIEVLNKTIDAQGRTVDSLVSRISQGTVPSAVHQQSLSKINDLEARISGMVSKSEYGALQRRYDEATRQINSMVPSSENDALEESLQELKNTISTMVPKEQFDSSEAEVRELKAKLAEHVPQSTYDELVSKVVQLAEEVTGGQVAAVEPEAAVSVESPEAEKPAPAEQGPDRQPSIPADPVDVPEEVKAETAPDQPQQETSPTGGDESNEVREVASQLAEIKTDALAEQTDSGPEGGNPEPESPAKETGVETEPGLAPTVTGGSTESRDPDTQSS